MWSPRQCACPWGSKARAQDTDLPTSLCSMCPSCTPTALRPHWLRPQSRLTNMNVWRGECKLLQEALALSAGKGWVQLGSLNKYRVQSGKEEPLGPKCPQRRSTRSGDAAPSSLLLDGVPASLPDLSWAGPRAQCLSGPCGLRLCNTGFPRFWVFASAVFSLMRNKSGCPWPEGPGALASRFFGPTFFTAGSFSPFNSQEVRRNENWENFAESIFDLWLRKGLRRHRLVAPPRGRSVLGLTAGASEPTLQINPVSENVGFT